MGTYMEIKAYGRRADAAVNAVIDRLQEIEARMAHNQATSEIAAVNQKAGIKAVPVSQDTFLVVAKALDFAQITGGKFDPTIQPIVDLWQIGSPAARVPAAAEIASRLPAVDYTAIELDPARNTIWLTKPGMGLDLGAIAKGYAADEAAAILRQHGIKSALINLGGNIYAVGSNPSGKPWRIGIQDPLDERNKYIAVLEVIDETLVTSGAYERFLEVEGQVYHHILDPTTGYPAVTDLLSVTIMTTKSIDADALSTSVFILGREAGWELINRLPGIEAVIIDTDQRVWATDGVRNRLTVVDAAYTLVP